jgi:hypothetical protein
MSREVSSAPMGEWHQRSVSGEWKMDNAAFRARGEAVMLPGVVLCPRP